MSVHAVLAGVPALRKAHPDLQAYVQHKARGVVTAFKALCKRGNPVEPCARCASQAQPQRCVMNAAHYTLPYPTCLCCDALRARADRVHALQLHERGPGPLPGARHYGRYGHHLQPPLAVRARAAAQARQLGRRAREGWLHPVFLGARSPPAPGVLEMHF